MSTNTQLTGVVAEHIQAVNAGDLDAVVATFAKDAIVNDARREIRGHAAIRGFSAKEIVGDHITMDVTEVVEQHGQTIVRAIFDGTYDKTNLPDPLILTSYYTVEHDKIVSLITILTQPSPY